VVITYYVSISIAKYYTGQLNTFFNFFDLKFNECHINKIIKILRKILLGVINQNHAEFIDKYTLKSVY